MTLLAKINARVHALQQVVLFEDTPSERRWTWHLADGTVLDYFHSTKCPEDLNMADSPALMRRLADVTLLYIKDFLPMPGVVDLLPRMRMAVHNGSYWFVGRIPQHYVYAAEYETESDDDDDDGGGGGCNGRGQWWHQFYVVQPPEEEKKQ